MAEEVKDPNLNPDPAETKDPKEGAQNEKEDPKANPVEKKEISEQNKVKEEERKANNKANDDLQARLNDLETKFKAQSEELKAVKDLELIDNLGVDKNHRSDVIALIKGNGDEVNDENIKAYVEKHPEWKASEDNQSGVKFLGAKGSNEQVDKTGKEAAEDVFGFKH